MGQILPGVVVLAFSLKGKNNRMANGMRIPTVVLAFSLKGKNNIIWNLIRKRYVVLAFSLKGKNNWFGIVLEL